MRTVLPLSIVMIFAISVVGYAGEQKAATPKTPSATAEHVVKQLSQSQPQALWQALPASYQRDLSGIVTEFSGKIDPEVYDQGFTLVKKLNEVISTQKAFILKHPMMKSIDQAAADQNWDAMTSLFTTILSSDVAKVETLKSLDIESFLSSTGASVLTQAERISKLAPPSKKENDISFFEMLKAVKFTTLSPNGDSAQLKVEIPNKPEITEDWVRVEGKWIPKKMADEWKKGIDNAKKGLLEIETPLKNKAQIMGQLKMFEGILDQFLAAKTEQEFNMAAAQILMPIMGMMMGGGGAPPPPQSK